MDEKTGAIVLTEVGPFVGDTVETIGYRSCDFCYQTVCEDIWAGKSDEADWRRFYRLEDGCICCENCLPALLPEVPR